jgi:hypothetical protein
MVPLQSDGGFSAHRRCRSQRLTPREMVPISPAQPSATCVMSSSLTGLQHRRPGTSQVDALLRRQRLGGRVFALALVAFCAGHGDRALGSVDEE